MKDKIVFPNIITDIFLFFLKQKPSPLWLTAGSVEGAAAQREKWNLPLAIHQRIAHSHSSLLLSFIPWGEVKRSNCPPASPTRMWASSVPLPAPFLRNRFLFLFSPHFGRRFLTNPQFSPEYTLASHPCPHTLGWPTVQLVAGSGCLRSLGFYGSQATGNSERTPGSEAFQVIWV